MKATQKPSYSYSQRRDIVAGLVERLVTRQEREARHHRSPNITGRVELTSAEIGLFRSQADRSAAQAALTQAAISAGYSGASVVLDPPDTRVNEPGKPRWRAEKPCATIWKV